MPSHSHPPTPPYPTPLPSYHPDKFERMKAVVRRYVDGDARALDAFPDGSEQPAALAKRQAIEREEQERKAGR